MKKYVLGFALGKEKVLLVRKTKPSWQKGKLNGVGGSVEDFDLSNLDAMVREFREESNVCTIKSDWSFVCKMIGEGWEVFVYRMNLSDFIIHKLHNQPTDTDEVLESLDKKELFKSQEVISNLPWLIGMCEDVDVYESKHYSVII